MKRSVREQQNTFKYLAREAKRRMKSGYWTDFDEKLKDKREEAVSEGNNPNKVLEFYVNKTIKTVNSNKDEDEFYLKVKDLVVRFGETSDAIGRLIDHSVYDGLSNEQKQRYTLELSNKYVEALERLRKEREFGCVNKEK